MILHPFHLALTAIVIWIFFLMGFPFNSSWEEGKKGRVSAKHSKVSAYRLAADAEIAEVLAAVPIRG